jgi:uncharacterized protein (DUF697 family)/GTP-binding protein EngB required for normal cell division
MESKPKKSETKLKIIIYGDNIDYKSIEKLYEKKKCKSKDVTKMNFSYTEISHNLLEWKFLIVKTGIIDNIINVMKDDYKNKYFHHVLLLYIENSESQIDIIRNIQNVSYIYFPFIIFISSNKKEKNEIVKLIEENELEVDFRTLLFLNNPEPIELLNILWEKTCYYNQLGNSITLPDFKKFEVKISKYFHSFNYFVIGKTGVGKSTFINILCGDLVALERSGANVTVGTKRYKCLNAPIYLYDTEGFSSGKELSQTKKKIFDTFSDLNKTRQTIHGIFYLFNGQSKRTFDDKEEDLINELFSKGIDIYFLLNFMSKNKNTSRTKNIFIEENQFRFNNPEYNKLFQKNLFVINLINENFDCHGLDKVFEVIYEKFKNDKINIEDVKKMKGDNNKIFPLLKHSSFFKNIKSSDDVLEYIKNFCSFEICRATILAGLVGGFDILPFADLPVIFTIQTAMIIGIAINFGIKLEKKKASELVKTLIASAGTTAAFGVCGYIIASLLKLIPGVGIIVGGIINGSVGASTTLVIGNLAIEYFSKIFGDEQVNYFLNSRAEECNKGIDFFNEFKNKLQNTNNYITI